jgi:hypothetical protein
MSFLNKLVEDSIKQAKLVAQMSELSYRALNGTRQTRSNFINNDLKEQSDTDKPAVGSLTSEMISQYKREEEENNKYVDPTGKEFVYDPTGMTPTIVTLTFVDVSALGKPANIVDVQTEQSNYGTIVRDLNDKKQDIQDKKIESKNKKSEVTVKQTKLKELEESYNKLKDTKDKLIVTGNDIQKRLGILTGISKKTKEEMEEMNELRTKLPELQKHLVVLNTKLQDIAAHHGTIFAEGKTLVAQKKVIDDEIKDMITVDIPKLETDLETSKK